MAVFNRRKIVPAMFLLFLVFIFFFLTYEPEPRVTIYHQAVITESINWNTYRLNVTHQGLAPQDCTVEAGLILEWRTTRLNRAEYSASKSSPAVNDEYIYIGLDTRAIIAIDRITGLVKWRHYTRFSKNGIHGSPTVDSKRNLVYIGAYDGWIYALNRDTGKLVWNTKLGDYIGSSPTLYKDIVYIGVEMRAPDGYLVGVDADTGKEVFRSSKLGNHPHSTPTIDPESDCIVIGENNGHIYCYWLSNQTERWKFKTGDDIKSTAAVSKGVVYITSWDGSLYAINITTGKSIWTHHSGYRSMSSPTIDPENDVVYYGNHGGVFYAVSTNGGKTLWKYTTEGKILSSSTLVMGTNTVVIGSNDGNIYLLDSNTGKLKQRIPLVSGLSGVPVLVGDHLYVFDNLGYLYSFRVSDVA
jgi:outer membrane protein assembly factor BamB